jgi:hypothetical protein
MVCESASLRGCLGNCGVFSAEVEVRDEQGNGMFQVGQLL